MEPKHLWPIVEFIVAATGLGPKDARRVLETVPEDRYTAIFIETNVWKTEAKNRAAVAFQKILGDQHIDVLTEGTQRATAAEVVADRKPRQRRKKA